MCITGRFSEDSNQKYMITLSHSCTCCVLVLLRVLSEEINSIRLLNVAVFDRVTVFVYIVLPADKMTV